jgi:hypothetical protein
LVSFRSIVGTCCRSCGGGAAAASTCRWVARVPAAPPPAPPAWLALSVHRAGTQLSVSSLFSPVRPPRASGDPTTTSTAVTAVQISGARMPGGTFVLLPQLLPQLRPELLLWLLPLLLPPLLPQLHPLLSPLLHQLFSPAFSRCFASCFSRCFADAGHAATAAVPRTCASPRPLFYYTKRTKTRRIEKEGREVAAAVLINLDSWGSWLLAAT